MKDKKLKEEIIFERRWLYHAKHEGRIFEVEEIKKAIKEGWKCWPWEVEIKEDEVKTPVVIEEIDCKPTKLPENEVTLEYRPDIHSVGLKSALEIK